MPYLLVKPWVSASRTLSSGGPSSTTAPSCCAALMSASISGVEAAWACQPSSSRKAVAIKTRSITLPFSLRVKHRKALRGIEHVGFDIVDDVGAVAELGHGAGEADPVEELVLPRLLDLGEADA